MTPKTASTASQSNASESGGSPKSLSSSAPGAEAALFREIQWGNLIGLDAKATLGNLPVHPSIPIKNEAKFPITKREISAKREEANIEHGEEAVCTAITRGRGSTHSGIGADLFASKEGTRFAFSTHQDQQENGTDKLPDYGDSGGGDIRRLARKERKSIMLVERQHQAMPTGEILEYAQHEGKGNEPPGAKRGK